MSATLDDESAVNSDPETTAEAVGPVTPVRPFYRPPVITPRSKLGTPPERWPWWAPAGWLLVALTSLIVYALLFALSPLMVLAIVGRRLWRRTLRYRRSPAALRIAIVGGGWSGLQCLARFRELGVDDVDVYERYDEIGGTWSPNLRYHGLQIHGSMTVTSFDGLPYSEDLDVQGGKVMGEEVERYIHRFAESRDLLRHCQLASTVESLAYSSADRTATLTISDTHTGEARTSEPYDLVIWASMAVDGVVPELPGAPAFDGRQIHTVSYSEAEFEDIVRHNRRVVLIGGGKAACDVALSLRRAGHHNVQWVMRKPYLFYKFEALLHDSSPMNTLRGLSYLPTVVLTGLSRRLGAVLHWSSGYLHTLGPAHTDFTHFHGGVLCATQRRQLEGMPYTIGNPVRFASDAVVLEDGAELPADVVIWATGNSSGIDRLALNKDGAAFDLSPEAKLYNHFVVPDLPAFASSTALWTSFGPMRATNAADLAVYHLAVRKERSERRMTRAAQRQISANSILRSFIWAKDACWLQQWVHFHIDLMLQGITPVEAFFKHALEVFVLGRQTPLRFNILPAGLAPAHTAASPAMAGGPAAAGAEGLSDRSSITVPVDAQIAPGSQIAGQAIWEIAWPYGTLILSVHRAGRLLMTEAATRLKSGDQLSALTHPSSVGALRALLGSAPTAPAALRSAAIQDRRGLSGHRVPDARSTAPAPPAGAPRRLQVGPLGRLGRYTATHFRGVLIAWVLIGGGLGMLAPLAMTALSGAGWESTGSQSLQARQLIDRHFQGLSSDELTVVVHSRSQTTGDHGFDAVVASVEHMLRASPAVKVVVAPSSGVSISADRHTVLVQAGAARNSNAMVKAADSLQGRIGALSSAGVRVELTGQPTKWADFNDANRAAMLKSEVISWPVTLGILLLAFGSLVAAGLPLMLTMIGLSAAAGLLYLGTLVMPISIWAMNFAMMFALALGIDYALFLVHRFRGAMSEQGLSPQEAVALTMDTAGKGVLFSGLTVLVSLSAVMLVPSPAFRSMSLGIMLSVLFVLAATLTLLPAVLARIGPKVNKLALPWAKPARLRSPGFERWAKRLEKRPLRYGILAVALLVGLALPITHVKTAMPTIKVIPSHDAAYVGYREVQAAFGKGYPGPLQIVAPAAEKNRVAAVLRRDHGVAELLPTSVGGGYALLTAIPKQDPDSPAVGATIDRLRTELPRGALLGGALAENHDLAATLRAKTPLVIGVVLGLGFLLLLIALQAPLVAALGVLTNLLAVGAAFGIATWIFQDGHLQSLLGFSSQGFLDAWGPVFYFAMIFAISMDYTVFLLSSAKEEWERSHDPRRAMVGGLACSGRVVLSAGAVMVAVFFTFALSGPLPPKEMGVILGVAVLLDAFLIRLLLLPVLLRLTGRAAWATPRWLRRILPNITFGHQ